MSRDELLGELSRTLGVPVFDVSRKVLDPNPSLYGTGERLPGRKPEWLLSVRLPGAECECGGPHTRPRQSWARLGPTALVRHATKLRAFAIRHGRSSRSGPFTAADTRTVLRLLHEITDDQEV